MRALALLLVVAAAVLLAADPAFEVASVKRNTSGSRARSLGYPPDRFEATNMPLRFLIGNAYGDTFPVRQDMILGGPSWIDSEGYDVDAKASTSPTNSASLDVMARKLMLRTLLADRFALKLHRETRELPLYALIVATPDRKMGPRLKPSTGEDCANDTRGDATSSPPPCGPGGPRPLGETGGYFVTMAEIGKALGQFVERPVIDKTGLTGRFTFELHFTPPPPARPNPNAPPDPPDPDRASIFTAVQEQLGLKLDPQRGPLEVLVIDSAERPTPN